ncbi:AAA family ATPase [Cereibacter azotoformans]|uniref:ATP-dependent nuclease n=1 Tax=Cereibacter azotoformans TaxID=43057 RepID=UPI001EEAA2C5|nr:AAA family ATPase [Cereibacter azotoformans]ULB11835.1 AAA family ATPase [Cereibacter azotoformans]
MEFEGFQVTNYRNIIDSGWINSNRITAFVGQNEAGKSNLFEALYTLNPIIPGADYSLDEDWPVDRWEGRKEAEGKLVCKAQFLLSIDDVADLAAEAVVAAEVEAGAPAPASTPLPQKVQIVLWRRYGQPTTFKVHGFPDGALDETKATEWAKANVPKFVYIHDYEMSGAQVELDQLKQRLDSVGGRTHAHKLSNEDQTILVILDLANIELNDFIKKGESAEGRTVRSFDKRSASKYLTRQFANLWQQKAVEFDIEIDGPTLNIFVEDAAVGMPVRLHRRSTGFRWYVSFAWKFTHATQGEFKDCVLLLEEPGVHLHFSGQRDLLKVFARLSEHNTILYTTHLASMVELSNPERVRIVESKDGHLGITQGIVSKQREPMAVIERSLGLTGDQSGLLGNRQVLIVEGGDDAIILHKLSGLLGAAGRERLSDRIYLWPAHGAAKTPMYAGFAIGQGWDAGVLLDSDDAGHAAKVKIDELYVSKLAEEKAKRFRTFMLGKTAGSKKIDFAIEDIFPDKFYLDCVNTAYGLAIKIEDLPQVGSNMITKRVEEVLKTRYGMSGLDKRRVLGEMWQRFDQWTTAAELPTGTAASAEKLFKAINTAFAERRAAEPN